VLVPVVVVVVVDAASVGEEVVPVLVPVDSALARCVRELLDVSGVLVLVELAVPESADEVPVFVLVAFGSLDSCVEVEELLAAALDVVAVCVSLLSVSTSLRLPTVYTSAAAAAVPVSTMVSVSVSGGVAAVLVASADTSANGKRSNAATRVQCTTLVTMVRDTLEKLFDIPCEVINHVPQSLSLSR
jgi:hypothetical protein